VNPITTNNPTVALDLSGEGSLFLDGAQWFNDALFYSIPASTQIRKTTDTTTAVSTMTNGIIGLALKGTTMYGARAPGNGMPGEVVSFPPGGANPTFTTVVGSAGTPPKAFDSPNDIAVRPNQTAVELWVTDPGYQKAGMFENRIYRIVGNTATVAASYGADDPRPNGIAFAKDGNTLYVSFTALKKISKFTVNAMGALDSPMGMAFVTYPSESALDGLAVDNDGNVYAATSAGVDVYKPGGTKWGTIAAPGGAVSVTFGGADGKTLYIVTASSKVLSAPLAVAGPVTN
jgi:DNA-binding beta-propeller fold protein YncE